MLKNICLLFTSLIICTGCITKHSEYTFGMKPEAKIDASVAAVKLIGQLQSRKDTAHVTVTIPKGGTISIPTAFSQRTEHSAEDAGTVK